MLVDSRTYRSAMETLSKAHAWVWDVETTGLGMGDRVCGVAVKTLGHAESYYFPFRHREGTNLSDRQFKQLLKAATARGRILIGYNVSQFDARMCRRDGMGWADTRDVLLGAFLVNENEGRGQYNIEAVANKYLGPESTSQQRQMRRELESRLLGKGDMWRLPPSIVEPYACEDVVLAERLHDFYLPHLEKQGLVEVWKGLSEYAQIMGLMLERGIPVDVDVCSSALMDSRTRITEIAMDIYRREKRVVPVNSPKSAAIWLGVESTNVDYLERLGRGSDWRVMAMLEYRKHQRAMSSYYKPLIADVVGGRYHPDLSLIGTVTGRPANWTGRGHMNPLAIPRDTNLYKVKRSIVAPRDMLIIEADYSGAEMRLGTHYAQEKRMAGIFRKGQNPHEITSRDLKIPYDPAKRINFSVIYGIGATTLAENLNVPIGTAADWLNRYHQRYPGFKKFYYQAQNRAERRRYVKMWTGRRRHYNLGSDRTPFHKAADHIIQGGVNELIRVKQTELHHELPDVEQFLQVYDSCLMLAPADVAEERAHQVREIMTCNEFVVPMEVKIKIGSNLEEVREI